MRTDYDFLLFDLDGTLVDVERSYVLDLLEQVGDEVGYHFSEEEAIRLWRALGGPPEAQLVRMGIQPDIFWDAFHSLEEPEARVDATFLYPDANVIGGLDVPVGLVTHCQTYLTEPVLRALDIKDWFDTIVCCHDGIGWKPDPRPVKEAMTSLGVSKNGSTGAMTGDTPADIGAAWNAGIDGIHIERVDPHERGMCIRADQRAKTLDEIIAPTTPRDYSSDRASI